MRACFGESDLMQPVTDECFDKFRVSLGRRDWVSDQSRTFQVPVNSQSAKPVNSRIGFPNGYQFGRLVNRRRDLERPYNARPTRLICDVLLKLILD